MNRNNSGIKKLLFFVLATFLAMNLFFVLMVFLIHPFFNWVSNDAWEIRPVFVIKRYFIAMNLFSGPAAIVLWIQDRFR
jgi:hypothetical protein